jgi:hypothetical protein
VDWLLPVEELRDLPLEAERLTLEQAMSLAAHVWDAPEEYIRRFMWIPAAKAGHGRPTELVRLEPNDVQKDLLAAVKHQIAQGRPVRIMVLKARQEGVSTIVEALGAALTMNTPAFSMWVVAHDRGASDNLFAMTERYIDKLDERVKPMVSNRDRKRIRFDNPDKAKRRVAPGLGSYVYVDQAKNAHSGRSATINFLHISERAFWGKEGRKTIGSLMQAVPSQPKTIVIQETTANGVDDAAGFYDDWWRYYGKQDGEWLCVFYPWFFDPRYRMPVPDDAKGEDGRLVLRPDPDGTMREERLREGVQHVSWDGTRRIVEVDDEQLYWRRWAINERCRGDVFFFMQEFPSTPEEAFQQSGNPWWDRAGMERLAAMIRPPVKMGTFYTTRPLERVRQRRSPGLWRSDMFDRAAVFSGRSEVRFADDPQGPWWIFEEPRPGAKYLVGVDVAEGGPAGDRSAVQVFAQSPLRQVAEYSGHIDVDLLAHQVAMACRYYNDAYCIPEVNGPGMAFMQVFAELWNRMYYRIDHDAVEDIAGKVRFGFRTTSVTRPVITIRGQSYVREGAVDIFSSRLFSEMQSFVKDSHGRPRAAGKGTDDLVMAFLLVLELHEQRPEQLRKGTRPLTLSDDAYYRKTRGREKARAARYF